MQYGGRIVDQIRRVGASVDWSREAFTLDAPRSAAVTHAFVTLFEQGLVQRRSRLVNWCPHLRTAISDIEVDVVQVRQWSRVCSHSPPPPLLHSRAPRAFPHFCAPRAAVQCSGWSLSPPPPAITRARSSCTQNVSGRVM
jgi:hypothetical protein